MVTKIKKSIDNSKRKNEFKKRQGYKQDKKNRQKNVEKHEFVDKRQLLKDKKDKQDARKHKRSAAEMKAEDTDMKAEGSEDESSVDEELQQELADHDEAHNPEALDETVFNKFTTGELDLPEDADDADELSEEFDEGGADDSELEAYYEELGIDVAEVEGTDSKSKKKAAKEDKLYKKQKKEDVRRSKVEEVKRERNEILNAMMTKAREETSYKTLTRIIQVVKAVLSEKIDKTNKTQKEEDEEMEELKEDNTEAQKAKKFSQSLSPEEYQRLVHFFASEVPTLALKLCQVKEFPSVEKLIQQAKFKQVKMGSAMGSFNLKNAYPGVNKKHQNLLKSYASNFNRLVNYYTTENQEMQSNMLTVLFSNGGDSVRCCLPFKVYTKKLTNNCARVAVSYGQVQPDAMILAFNTLRSCIMWAQDATLYEATLKRMYNEFFRASKVGGGSYDVQDALRTSQNCFIELLAIDRAIGYQLGFQYIRQLCVHLRTIRNSLTKDALKNIYSWQFYHCLKLWVLALTNAKISDLALLVHPIVQLIVGVMRLSNNIKYFPFHVKLFDLIVQVNAKTGQFVPAAQYILYPMDSSNMGFFNSKPKPLQDKAIPDTLVSLKFAKKHVVTQEARDRVVKEIIEALTSYLAANGSSLAFPELVVPITVLLRKFKKNANSANYKKTVQSFLDLVTRHETYIAQNRSKIKDKSLRDPAKLFLQFATILQTANQASQSGKGAESPFAKEQAKVERARNEHMSRKMEVKKGAAAASIDVKQK